MAKMKFDVKQFMMQKGERVGLGVALGLMGLLLLWGIIGALSARSPAQDIAKAADQVNQAVNSQQVTISNEGTNAPPEIKEWVQGVNPDWLRMVPFFEPNAAGNAKRSMPVVLPPDYNVVDGFPVLVGQYDVVFVGAKGFEVENRSVTHLIAKGGKNVGFGVGKGGMPGSSPPGKGGGFAGPGGLVGGPGGMKGGNVSDKKYKEILIPVHALVVSATYPVKEQLEQIRKALRYNSVKEMFESATGDAQPEFGGLMVVRRELTADGKLGEWLAMKLDDPAGPTMKLYEQLKGFEPEDEEQLKHIFPGLVMPRPYSLTADYPQVELKDIPKGEKRKHDDKAMANAGPPGFPGRGGMPGGVGPGGIGGGPGGRGGYGPPGGGLGMATRPDYTTQEQSFDSLPKEYEGPEAATKAKFEGKFDIFEPGGFPREHEEQAVPGGKKQPDGVGPGGVAYGKGDPRMSGMMKGMQGQGQQFKAQESRVAGLSLEKLPDKGLVRFVDVTVKPGHTYQYMIKVRLRNPNFKKKTHEVASTDLARKEFVDSPWVFTEPVRVSPEIVFYNVDQSFVETAQDYQRKHMKGVDLDAAGRDRVAVQIHRFLGVTKDAIGSLMQVGDWAVAERLLIPRGEYVGRPVEVEMPAWDFAQEDFELIRDKSKRVAGGAVQVDFSTRPDPNLRTIVVDFRGGRVNYPVGANASPTQDESASELLILGPDLKLAVRNSRAETDPANNPAAVERIDRLNHLRERIHDLKHPRPQTAPLGGRGGPGS